MTNLEEESFVVSVHLINGDPIRLTLGKIETQSKLAGINDDLERALMRHALAIELDNKLMIIPYSNIKYIECDPAPPELPLTILRGAKTLSD